MHPRTPSSSSHAEQTIARDMAQLWDRVGDELGIYLKPIMYAVRLNDAESEKDLLSDIELEKYRFYLCEGVPIDNSKNGSSFGTAFDDTRNEFLRCLKEIAESKKLDLVFPDDASCVCCNDLAPLREAIEIMKKKNHIITPKPVKPRMSEDEMKEWVEGLVIPGLQRQEPNKNR